MSFFKKRLHRISSTQRGHRIFTFHYLDSFRSFLTFFAQINNPVTSIFWPGTRLWLIPYAEFLEGEVLGQRL